MPLADVEVRDQVTSNLVQLYSDYAGASAIGNPITADADGFVQFYVATGRYRIEATAGVVSRVWEDEVLGVFGDYIEYDRTPAEITASVIPINKRYREGVWDRYLTNTTPGTTDMTTAIQAALDVHNAGGEEARGLASTYLTGKINWPGNNLTLRGAACAYSYNTSATPKTILKAKTGTVIVLDLVQTGVAEDRTGNFISDIDVDGNSIAVVGVDMAGTNILHHCRTRGCTTAGTRLSNFTNSSRIINCGFNSNSGWGLLAEGVSTTTFSVEGCVFSLNTLGAHNLEAGVIVNFKSCVFESNTGPGARIYRRTAHTNAFSHITYDTCWFEDNGSATPFYTIVIDSEAVGDTSKDPEHIVFRNCRISSAVSTRKYANINVCKNVTFDSCKFAGSTQTDALTLSSNARFVAFLECATGLISSGLTATQIDNAIAQGNRCYSHDRDVKRVVGAGAPAAAFAGTWVNYGSPRSTAKYWFDREGNVHFCGSIKTGTINTTAFTLPVGYRPADRHDFGGESNGAYGQVTINPDGTVVPTVGNNTSVSLDNVQFPTG